MADAPAPKKKEKKVQYYKVINTKDGHHGLFYKVGITEDPRKRPLGEIGTCESGAIYFTNAEYILRFDHYGDSIAWVTPISRIKLDEGGNKWKAHKIKITKILPIKDAIRFIRGISIDSYESYVKITVKEVLESSRWDAIQKFNWLRNDHETMVAKFLVSNKRNRKLIAHAKSYDIEWSSSDVKLFLENGLEELVNIDTIRNLFYDEKYDLLQKVYASNPKEFLGTIRDLI